MWPDYTRRPGDDRPRFPSRTRPADEGVPVRALPHSVFTNRRPRAARPTYRPGQAFRQDGAETLVSVIGIILSETRKEDGYLGG